MVFPLMPPHSLLSTIPPVLLLVAFLCTIVTGDFDSVVATVVLADMPLHSLRSSITPVSLLIAFIFAIQTDLFLTWHGDLMKVLLMSFDRFTGIADSLDDDITFGYLNL